MKNSATPAMLDLDDLLKAVESAKSYASVASESQPVQIRIASENSREGGGGGIVTLIFKQLKGTSPNRITVKQLS